VSTPLIRSPNQSAVAPERLKFNVETVRYRDSEGQAVDPLVHDGLTRTRGPMTLEDAFYTRIAVLRDIDLEYFTAQIVESASGDKL
jgi:hypothetical protein